MVDGHLIFMWVVIVLIRVAKKPSTINTQPSQQLFAMCKSLDSHIDVGKYGCP